MSYTNRFGQPQGVAKELTTKLREVLIAEVIAINGYAEHIANSNMKDVNDSWYTIMLDEKNHYGMILSLIHKYDPAEYKQYLEDEKYRNGPKSPMQTYVPDYDKQIILNNIRQDVKGESEAIILYEQLSDSFNLKDVRQVLRSIINEEKGHTEHLTQLLLKYDPDPYDGLN